MEAEEIAVLVERLYCSVDGLKDLELPFYEGVKSPIERIRQAAQGGEVQSIERYVKSLLPIVDDIPISFRSNITGVEETVQAAHTLHESLKKEAMSKRSQRKAVPAKKHVNGYEKASGENGFVVPMIGKKYASKRAVQGMEDSVSQKEYFVDFLQCLRIMGMDGDDLYLALRAGRDIKRVHRGPYSSKGPCNSIIARVDLLSAARHFETHGPIQRAERIYRHLEKQGINCAQSTATFKYHF